MVKGILPQNLPERKGDGKSGDGKSASQPVCQSAGQPVRRFGGSAVRQFVGWALAHQSLPVGQFASSRVCSAGFSPFPRQIRMSGLLRAGRRRIAEGRADRLRLCDLMREFLGKERQTT